jgi:hypothetical protein
MCARRACATSAAGPSGFFATSSRATDPGLLDDPPVRSAQLSLPATGTPSGSTAPTVRGGSLVASAVTWSDACRLCRPCASLVLRARGSWAVSPSGPQRSTRSHAPDQAEDEDHNARERPQGLAGDGDFDRLRGSRARSNEARGTCAGLCGNRQRPHHGAGAEKHHRKRDREARSEGSEQMNPAQARARASAHMQTPMLPRHPAARSCGASASGRAGSSAPLLVCGNGRQRYDQRGGRDRHTPHDRHADAHADGVTRQSRGRQGEGRQPASFEQLISELCGPLLVHAPGPICSLSSTPMSRRHGHGHAE